MATTDSNPDSDPKQQPTIPVADALRITEIVQAIDAWWMQDTRVRLRAIERIAMASDFDYVIEVTIHKGYHKARPVRIAIDTKDTTEAAMLILHRAAFGDDEDDDEGYDPIEVLDDPGYRRWIERAAFGDDESDDGPSSRYCYAEDEGGAE